MFELRPYQEQAVKSGLEFFNNETKYNWALMVLPTGSWKSLVIANIAKDLDGDCIILQPSKEILEQNYAKLLSYWVTDCKVYSASLNSKKVWKMTLATIWSIIKNKDLFSHFKYIIIDECHLVSHLWGQYNEFIKHLNWKVLWLTATPYRLTQYNMGSILKFLTRVRNPIFSKVIHCTQIDEIEKQWFLSDMKYYDIDAIDPERLQVNSTWLDYTDISMRNHFSNINLDEKVIDVVKRVIKQWRKHILLFTKFVEDAQRISKKLDWEVSCTYVSWETPKKQREEILKKFKDWSISVVANVWVLTTWFDFPELDVIILARPTRSLALYYQMVGRWMRPHNSKENCWVIDMSKTKERFWKVKDLILEDQGNWKWVINSQWKTLTNVFIK